MKRSEIIKLIKILKKMYPDAKCSLDFSTPFELGIAVMLSAQCTDERVNKVTETIFPKYNTPQQFVNMDITKLEGLIRSCGFYKNKAKNIKQYSKQIIEKHNGELPQEMDELIDLAGIGRKSANVIMLEAFGKAQGIAVDTHCKRIANRLGLSKKEDPNKIEQDLIRVIPEEYFEDVNHLFIWHGRNICVSRKPKCNECPVKKYCEYCK
ncbi:MAG: endonuclease III [Oscillospiraceae bacterium]|nr:endonuclease III [Oscillospiraceae bacterium]